MKNEAVNLKENEMSYMQGNKGKGEMMLLYYHLKNKIKKISKTVALGGQLPRRCLTSSVNTK